MLVTIRAFFTIGLLSFVFSQAFALTVEEKNSQKKWQAQLAKRAKSAEKDCGINIPTKLSKSVITEWVAQKRSPTNFSCEEVLGAVRDLCKNPDSKPLVTSKIKKIVCVKGKKPGKLGLRIKKDTLFASITTKTTGIQSKTRTWLEKKFKVGNLTVEENNEMKRWTKSVTDRKRYFIKTCGVEVPFKLEASVAPPFVKENRNAANPCVEAIQGVIYFCKEEQAKARLVERVKSISCSFNSAEDKAEYELKGDQLIIRYGVKTYSLDSSIRSFLEGEL